MIGPRIDPRSGSVLDRLVWLWMEDDFLGDRDWRRWQRVQDYTYHPMIGLRWVVRSSAEQVRDGLYPLPAPPTLPPDPFLTSYIERSVLRRARDWRALEQQVLHRPRLIPAPLQRAA